MNCDKCRKKIERKVFLYSCGHTFCGKCINYSLYNNLCYICEFVPVMDSYYLHYSS